ncbi:MAG: hypothetical protein SangKO_099110 [Sandaracinaceae bacterium]
MRLRLLLLLALATTASAQPRDTTRLAFFDALCCQPGNTPVDQHTPEIGAVWTVEGTTLDADKPKITSSSLIFESGSPAIAVAEAPGGERTLRVVLREPAGHTADVSATLFERYQSPDAYTALRVRWSPTVDDPQIALMVATNGTVQETPLGTVTGSGYHQPLPVTIHSLPVGSGHVLTVTVGTDTLQTITTPGFVGETRFALGAEAPIHPNPDGHFARIEDVVVLTPSAPTTVVCDGLTGWPAESCIRAAFAPVRTTEYPEARDYLFETIWVEHVSVTHTGNPRRHVPGLYGGRSESWAVGHPLSAREQLQNAGYNTEHVWPRSRGAQPLASPDGPAHNDLHHLAPTHGAFNTARSNRAFGDAFDQENDTYKWLRTTTTRYASSGPPSDLSTWSRVERDFLRQPDDGDGFKSLPELGRFDVRHEMRGDVARMAAYFLTLYRIEAEDGTEGRAFIDATLEVLLRWHEQDPVDAFELERNERIYRTQGNRNPFVLDPTLLGRTFYQGAGQPRPRDLWINEIHHSNDGPDVGEGVEIAGRAGTDLYGYRVWTYSGYGALYQIDGDGTDGSPAIAFRGIIDDEGGGASGQPGYGAVWARAERLRGGCQGLALTDPDGIVLQFLSTGGCQFNATGGPVFDAAENIAPGAGSPPHPDSLAWSTGIRGPRPGPGQPHRRVQEWSTLPAGHSIQLSGSGTTYADFDWLGPLPASPGRLNDYQAPASSANRTSGWSSGAPIPLGLLAPPVDTGHDEDAPQDLTPSIDEPAGDELAVSLPSPNPTASSTRVRVAAPASATVTAEVFDALGRRIAIHMNVEGHLQLDTSALSSGTYLIRIAASRPGHAPQLALRRFTVIR